MYSFYQFRNFKGKSKLFSVKEMKELLQNNIHLFAEKELYVNYAINAHFSKAIFPLILVNQSVTVHF